MQGRETALAAGESRRGGEEEMKTCKDSHFSTELRLSRSPHSPSERRGRQGVHTQSETDTPHVPEKKVLLLKHQTWGQQCHMSELYVKINK